MPPGLEQFDPALQAFAEFFAIDQDLIGAAAEISPGLTATEEPLEQWVTLLAETERNAFLLRMARAEVHVGIEVLRRLREVGGAGKPIASTAPRRTFAELQVAAKNQEQLRVQRARAEAERARLAKLVDLAQREARSGPVSRPSWRSARRAATTRVWLYWPNCVISRSIRGNGPPLMRGRLR